jgi:hypothetical protein
MRRFHNVLTASAVALLVGFVLATISAQPLDKRTFFTFSAPVKLPGLTLPPGKYLFRVADPETGGRVVQVLSADGKTLYGTFFAIPAERLDPAPAPEVRFIETPAGTPPAIKEWWNQGELIGREFIYPRQEAMLLAKSSSRPVLTTKSNTTTVEQTKNADLSRLSPNGQETNVNANDKPQASAPTGATQVGEVAPITIVIVAAPRR